MDNKIQKYSALIGSGVRFLLIKDFNRNVLTSKVKVLKESIKRTGAVLDPIRVIKVSMYRKDFPDTVLFEPQAEDTKTIEALDKDFVVLDGQHRLKAYLELSNEAVASNEQLGFDLPVQEISLPEALTPHDYLYVLNTTGTQWNDKDRTKFILASNPKETTGLKVANKWQQEYGLGIRNATAIIQLNDGYKASMQKNYIEKKELDSFLKSTPENIERGERIFKSLQIGFKNHPKMLKNMAPIKAIIEIYGETADELKSEIINQICTFFKAINEKEVDRIAGLSSISDKQKELVCLWKTFKKDFDSKKSFQEKMAKEAAQREEEFTQKTEESKGTPQKMI